MATDEQLLAALDSLGSAAPPAPLTAGEKATGYARSFASGPLLNFNDSLEAALLSLTGRDYTTELRRIQTEQDRFKAGTDYADNIVEVGSSFLSPLGKLFQMAKGANVGSGVLGKLFRSVANPTAVRVVANPVSEAAISGVGAADIGEDALKASGFSAAVGGAGSVVSNVLGRGLSSAARESDKLKLSAFGLKGADARAQLKKMGDGVEKMNREDLPLLKTLKGAEKKGLISVDNDLLENIQGIGDAQKNLGKSLATILAQADGALPANASFGNVKSKEYIGGLSGKAKVQAQTAYNEEIEALMADIGDGTIADLQRLKTGLNYKYDENPYRDSIVKSIRSDIRAEIESRVDLAAKSGLIPKKHAGQVKALNSEWGNLQELQDAFLGRAHMEYGADFIDQLSVGGGSGSLRGAANIAAATSGNPLAVAASGALAAGRAGAAKNVLADAASQYQIPLAGFGALIQEGGRARPIAEAYQNATEETTPGAGSLSPSDAAAIRSFLSEIQSLSGSQKKNEIAGDPMAQVDMDLLKQALSHQESRGKADAVSVKGAVGKFQIMPATAREIAKELGIEKYDLKDPETSDMFGTHYLQKQLDKFGDVRLALAAYNAGPGAVARWISRWGDDWDVISKGLRDKKAYAETVAYVPAIMSHYERLQSGLEKV